MKVLVVSNGFPPRGQWGTEFYTHEMVQGLIGRGHEMVVLHPIRDGSKPRYTLEEVRGSGDVPVWLLHNPGDPNKAFVDSYSNPTVEELFRQILDRVQPDVVHFTYLLWGLSVRLPCVAREAGVPTVVTLTDYSLLCHRGQMFDWRLTRCFGPHPPATCARCIREPSRFDVPKGQLFARRMVVRSLALAGGFGLVVSERDLAAREAAVRECLEAVDQFIAPTRVLGDAFRSFGIPADKVTELVYAIREEGWAVARPEPPRPVRFGFLGQFKPHKGLATLLEAARLMQHRLPESLEDWEVSLYGAPVAGRHRLYASSLLAELRGPRVQVHEPFMPTEAAAVLARLHAVVMPSEWDENAPLTVLQARAAGVPILGSDVPGIREVLEPGVHGELFPVGDAEALANHMRAVVLGKLGRHAAVSPPCSLEDHLDAVLGVYARARGREVSA